MSTFLFLGVVATATVTLVELSGTSSSPVEERAKENGIMIYCAKIIALSSLLDW